jgi:hypothetical protein
MNFVRGGILIGSTPNLSCGPEGVLARRNLNKSLGILVATTAVVGTPQMVFINPITTIYENKTPYRPLMDLIATGGYKSTEAENLRGGY